MAARSLADEFREQLAPTKSTTQKQIEKNFRKLILKIHPDKTGVENERATAILNAVKEELLGKFKEEDKEMPPPPSSKKWILVGGDAEMPLQNTVVVTLDINESKYLSGDLFLFRCLKIHHKVRSLHPAGHLILVECCLTQQRPSGRTAVVRLQYDEEAALAEQYFNLYISTIRSSLPAEKEECNELEQFIEDKTKLRSEVRMSPDGNLFFVPRWKWYQFKL